MKVEQRGGGVTVSYYEWVQDQQKLAWQGEEIVARLKSRSRTP